MANVTSTTYLNLWISSFFNRDNEGQTLAKNLSSSLSGSSMGLAIMFTVYIGYKADKVKISNLLILVYGIGTIGLLLFTIIEDINSKLLYLAVIFLNIGNNCENIVVRIYYSY